MAQRTSQSRQKSNSSNQRSGSSGNGSSASSRPRTASSSKRTQSSRSTSGSRGSSSGNRSGASSGNRSGASSGNRSRSSSGNRSRSSGGNSVVENVRDAVSSGAQTTGSAIGTAASKAKGPVIAGGAALAGLVGGAALASRGGRRRVLGVPVPGTRRALINVKRPTRGGGTRDLMKAAGQVGNAGRQMAELASEVRMAREQMTGNGRRRSPVEVVLDGL